MTGERFAVKCLIDGVWFANDAVFPDREQARAYGRETVECGAAARYRITVTDAPVKLPQEEQDDEPSALDGSFSSNRNRIDWAEFFDLVVLCPASFRGVDDGDMDRVLETSSCDCSLGGTVLA